ncbi:DUF4123 domain-containing protein [Pseudomonas sp. 148P]|uniref:DUF4123 domain-containing protein n=1 Tax=Pseudomonas ulcerans TaxID=3115852 RepID=A0ABU7HUP5_9PSED|nr:MULTISPECIES: DUF4123 domain-containing protein [unclassified Pseudomonas]MEE1924018.1 DUF4123 domain-containing protein [Pseudomonas sp. 147P]MEE1935219.1 DUF4123 domain-containing protein [Pseudomonas sp. 148P]
MSERNVLPHQWLNQQRTHGRQLLVIANPMAESNPVPVLFANGPLHEYVKLYQGTGFDNLATLGPWLIRIETCAVPGLLSLLQKPESHWGWVASAETLDMDAVVAHWRARMLVREGRQRAFYRLQDNRVIARHLKALAPEQIPLLLGPLYGALCWDGGQWLAVDNPAPGHYPEPFPTPWLEIPPAQVDPIGQQALLMTWLWENHPQATRRVADQQPLPTWLEAQMASVREWQWSGMAQTRFLLEHQLCPALATHEAWAPRPGETPDAHFLRAERAIVQAARDVKEWRG